MSIRFGIDIDGTVTSPSSLIPFLNKAFGLNLTLADIKQYELTPLVDISEAEFANWFMENEAEMYRESPIAEGAKEALIQWAQEHELYFISARRNHLYEETKTWFDKHEIPYCHIELIGKHDKIDAVKQHQVQVFLEDKHDNAVMIAETCDIPVLLFDTPYNQDPIPAKVIRVKDWHQAVNWVNKWIKEKK
ncbi:hypothetical protein [Pseudoneobacillus sp. C159]